MLNGEEDKVTRFFLEEWFRSKVAFCLGGLVFQYFTLWGWGLLGFSRRTSGVGEKFVPVIAIAAYDIGDLTEGLVRDNVVERHGG